MKFPIIFVLQFAIPLKALDCSLVVMGRGRDLRKNFYHLPIHHGLQDNQKYSSLLLKSEIHTDIHT